MQATTSHLLFLHSEAAGPIRRDILGPFRMLTTFGFEEGGSKVKFNIGKRFLGHDFLQVVFTFQTPSSNDKGDIRPF